MKLKISKSCVTGVGCGEGPHTDHSKHTNHYTAHAHCMGGGRHYEIERVVDECETDKGRYYRVEWKGHTTHTWEPLWELVGDKIRPGEGREAVQTYTDSKTDTGTPPPPPKGGDCIPSCPGGNSNVHSAVGGQLVQ